MEHLTIDDAPLLQQGGGQGQAMGVLGVAPPPNQQLPPQMFTTAAQLLDLTDSKALHLHLGFVCCASEAYHDDGEKRGMVGLG